MIGFLLFVLFVSCMMWQWSLSSWKIDMFCVLLSSVAFSQYLLSMSHLCQVRHCSECAVIPHAMTARLEVRCQTTRKHKTTSGIKCWNSSRFRKPAQCYNMIWTIVSYAGWLYHVLLHSVHYARAAKCILETFSMVTLEWIAGHIGHP